LNAVIAAIVKKGILHYDDEFIGFLEGWRGVLENKTMPLTLESVDGIITKGGTILHSSRTNVRKIEGGIARCVEVIKTNKIDAIIALGGDDTQSVTKALIEAGVPGVGVPKTIDNDLNGTDACFGFDTAVMIATEAIDRLHTTAESHHRALVVEVMGRHAGWIALHSGLAGGASVILVPERHFNVDQVVSWVERRFEKEFAPIIVVAEGALPEGGEEKLLTGEKDAFGHVRLGGIGTWLADEIAARTGKESRAVVLGHVQRGGTPTAYDRVLATRFGLNAVDAVADGDFGVMVALRGTDIVRVKLSEATAELKTVPAERYEEAEVFFG